MSKWEQWIWKRSIRSWNWATARRGRYALEVKITDLNNNQTAVKDALFVVAQ